MWWGANEMMRLKHLPQCPAHSEHRKRSYSRNRWNHRSGAPGQEELRVSWWSFSLSKLKHEPSLTWLAKGDLSGFSCLIWKWDPTWRVTLGGETTMSCSWASGTRKGQTLWCLGHLENLTQGFAREWSGCVIGHVSGFLCCLFSPSPPIPDATGIWPSYSHVFLALPGYSGNWRDLGSALNDLAASLQALLALRRPTNRVSVLFLKPNLMPQL